VRLLIDECLHTSLTDIANKAGFEAHHVNWRGWSGLTDRELLDLVVREEFVFVTNNARDFRKLTAEAELHAGLILIAPNVRPIVQAELFERALHEIAQIPDMISKVVEIDFDELRIYELPNLGIIETTTFRLIKPHGQLRSACDWWRGRRHTC
jgi:predicted nuclease of predicted toxin-antitoxin system